MSCSSFEMQHFLDKYRCRSNDIHREETFDGNAISSHSYDSSLSLSLESFLTGHITRSRNIFEFARCSERIEVNPSKSVKRKRQESLTNLIVVLTSSSNSGARSSP